MLREASAHQHWDTSVPWFYGFDYKVELVLAYQFKCVLGSRLSEFSSISAYQKNGSENLTCQKVGLQWTHPTKGISTFNQHYV